MTAMQQVNFSKPTFDEVTTAKISTSRQDVRTSYALYELKST